MGQDGYKNFLYPSISPYPIYLFIFLTGMRIDLNKWDKVGMGVTHPELASLSFLITRVIRIKDGIKMVKMMETKNMLQYLMLIEKL